MVLKNFEEPRRLLRVRPVVNRQPDLIFSVWNPRATGPLMSLLRNTDGPIRRISCAAQAAARARPRRKTAAPSATARAAWNCLRFVIGA